MVISWKIELKFKIFCQCCWKHIPGNMMSFHKWLILLIFYIVYLAFGGLIFNRIEFPNDCKVQKATDDKNKEISDSIQKIVSK